MRQLSAKLLALVLMATIAVSCNRKREAVFEAVRRGDIEYVENTVRHGFPVDSRDELGAFALVHVAAMYERHEILKFLLEEGANLEDKDDTGATVLTYAAIIGNNDMVLELLARGANINHQDMFGATPLYHAMRKGNYGTVRLLLDAGARANLPIERGKFPIDMADEDTPAEIIELLEQAMASADTRPTPPSPEGDRAGQEAVESP